MTNSNKQFSIGEALSFGWNTFKINWGLLLGAFIIFVLISGGVDYVLSNIFPATISTGFSIDFSGIILFIVNTFLTLGLIKIVLALHDKKETAIGDLCSCANLLIAAVTATFLYLLMVCIGFVLLVLPGMNRGIMFQFYGFVIVDKKVVPIQALKESKKITCGLKENSFSGVNMNLFLFDLSLLGINIVGVLCLVVGLLVTIPITFLSCAYVYRKLLNFEEGT